MAAGTTEIQWTWKFNKDGSVASKGRTWNTGSGCRHRGPECLNCYAEALHGMRHKAYMEGKTGLPKQYAKPFSEFQQHADRLELPLRWQEGCRIFVNSMTDTFHEDADAIFVAGIFATMAMADWHTFLVLTKRPRRALELLSSASFRELVADQIVGRVRHIKSCPSSKGKMSCDCGVRAELERAQGIRDGSGWPLPNVWIGVSCGTQATADRWIPLLLKIPAAIRFLSCEPLLGAVELTRLNYLPAANGMSEMFDDCLNGRSKGPAGQWMATGPGIDWVIVGGESGAGDDSRPMHIEWAKRIRDDCIEAGVPFFFKQWGDWTTGENVEGPGRYKTKTFHSDHFSDCSDDWATEADNGPIFYRVGKKAAGRLLDGQEWNQYPEGK